MRKAQRMYVMVRDVLFNCKSPKDKIEFLKACNISEDPVVRNSGFVCEKFWDVFDELYETDPLVTYIEKLNLLRILAYKARKRDYTGGIVLSLCHLPSWEFKKLLSRGDDHLC